MLDRLSGQDRYVLPSSFANIHLGLGEIDAAFEWFDRAVGERGQNMMPILSYAHFDPIRKDTRFSALLRKMKLWPSDAVSESSPLTGGCWWRG